MSLISFVFPVHNEEGNLPKLWEEITEFRKKLDKKYKIEFIFVDDGSRDSSLEILKKLQKKEKDIKILSFSRNYGHQIAVTAGQDQAKGDAVIIMDTDLQDPIMTCIDLIKKWEEGYDVVFAQRRVYKTNFIKQSTAFVFYRLLEKIASVKIPVDTGDFRLLSKRVNDEMRKYKEKSRFLRGISSLVGFKQTAVMFDRADRYSGDPSYTFKKSLKLALDGITGFSVFPLKIITITGSILSFGSIIFGFAYVLYSLLSDNVISGWASLMTGVFFLGGVQLLMLGILAEYVGRVYTEVLNRPLYTIDEKIGFDN